MIKHILSDFSQVILDGKDKKSPVGINKQYELLKTSENFHFFDYFELNNELIDLYSKLHQHYPMSILTTGYIQNAPDVRAILDPIFIHIFSGADFDLDKATPEAYLFVANKLHLKPDEILYVDDQKKNVEAANAAGLVAVQYVSVEKLKEDLKKLMMHL